MAGVLQGHFELTVWWSLAWDWENGHGYIPPLIQGFKCKLIEEGHRGWVELTCSLENT